MANTDPKAGHEAFKKLFAREITGQINRTTVLLGMLNPKQYPPPKYPRIEQFKFKMRRRYWELRERIGFAIAGHDPRDEWDE